MYTYRNNRSGEVVNTPMGREELLREFASCSDDHWAWFWIAKHVQESRQAPAMKEMLAFLADSFLYAIGMGLKNPMIRLHHGGRRFKVYLSKRGTVCFKSGGLRPGTNDPEGDEEYVGCLFDGRFLKNKHRPLLPVEKDFLDRLNADPVGFMAQASKDMGRCCYCNQPLEDQRSKDVGYGQVCAGRWGLPWGSSYDEKVPSFAALWGRAGGEDRRSIRQLCAALRKDPGDALGWDALGDALEEAGFTKRPRMPERKVVVPAG
jgi:hypothetical protein